MPEFVALLVTLTVLSYGSVTMSMEHTFISNG